MITDKNGIPILGSEDRISEQQIEEMKKMILMSKGIIEEMKQELSRLSGANLNMLVILVWLFNNKNIGGENKRLRIKIKDLDTIKAQYIDKKINIQSYNDKQTNDVVFYLNESGVENESDGKK